MLTQIIKSGNLYLVEKNSTRGGEVTLAHVYDYSKLKGKIREVFGTQGAFAKSIQLSDVSVSNKLNNLIDWKQEEIEKSIEQLMIPHDEIHVYFFKQKVENNSTKTE